MLNKYHLAKLVQWAGTLHSRKRMQKVVYLLQAAGCPINADYILHHYGPYSQVVSRLSDEMVRTGLLGEELEENAVGRQYSYRLTDRSREQLSELEATPSGSQMAQELVPFEQQAKDLLNADLWELEVASTVVYFRRIGHGWPESVERTCKFKNLTPKAAVVRKAESLARQILPDLRRDMAMKQHVAQDLP